MHKEIDTELLISIVEQYPSLWNKTKSRAVTTRAWDEVCKKLNPNFDALDEKQKYGYGQLVSRRWRNVRDCFIKSRKKSLESNGESKTGTTYIFEKQCAFLEGVVLPPIENTCRPTPIKSPNNTCNDPAVIKIEEGAEDTEVNLDRPASSRKRNNNTCSSSSSSSSKTDREPQGKKSKTDETENNQTHVESLDVKEDRHMSFFKSLMPSVCKLEEEQILEFQIGILKLIQEIRSRKVEPQSS